MFFLKPFLLYIVTSSLINNILLKYVIVVDNMIIFGKNSSYRLPVKFSQHLAI